MSSLPPDDAALDDLSSDDLELVSAYVDGEATPAEVARVEGSPRLLASVERLRVVASAVAAAPTAVDPAVRDAAIARAVAGAGAEVATVHALAGVRRRRHREPRRWLPALSAAAAVLLFLALLPALLRSAGGDDDQSATGLAESAATTAAAADSAGTPPAASGSGGGTGETTASDALKFSFRSVGDVGSYDDADVLVDEVRVQFEDAQTEDSAPATTMAPTASNGADPCEQRVRAGDAEVQALVFVATALLDREPVHALVFVLLDDGVPPTFRTYVVDEDCAVVTTDDF